MSFDWSQYLILAKELSTSTALSCSEEALKRCAISRAYYSVLIQSRSKMAARLGVRPPKWGTHGWTLDRLRLDGDRHLKQIGIELGRIKKKREKADYEDDISNISKELDYTLQVADKIEAQLATL